MLKLAIVVIFSAPALWYGLRWSWRGVEAGLIQRKVPWADEVVTGKLAVALGIYSLLWFTAILGVVIWFAIFMLG